MKKSLLFIAVLLCATTFADKATAQVGFPKPLIYGVSPFQDSLWAIDTTGYTVAMRLAPSLAANTITGMNGLAFDPCGLETYGIAKLSAVSGRVLVKINLNTGQCSQVGNLGDNFSSITFDRNGQLYGTTGDGAAVPESFWSIDKTTGAKILLTALGNGADGEVICYHPVTDMFYHWSGNTPVAYEKFRAIPPYTITTIGTSGTVSGETFGALYLTPNSFMISNISSNFLKIDTLGFIGPALSANPDDLRGLVMLPAFGLSDDTLCVNESMQVGATGVNIFNVIYRWGDGNADTVFNGGASHTYSAAGNYSLVVLLDNGYCTPDTFWTAAIKVNALPVVTINGKATLCPGDTNLLTGSSGGSSQWYLNGTLIPGADTNILNAAFPEHYNMIKTNLNGCSDSSATGITLYDVTNPVVYLGEDDTVCGHALIDASAPGATYLWSTLETTASIMISATDEYFVVLTDSNGCAGNDTIAILVHPLPMVTYEEITDSLCLGAGTFTLTAGTPAGGIYSGPGVAGSDFSASTAGAGSHSIIYEVTDLNACAASDTSVIVVMVCTSVGSLSSNEMRVYPNPGNGLFTLTFTGTENLPRQVFVRNALGEVVFGSFVAAPSLQIDLSQQNNGIYFVLVQEKDQMIVFKLVKVD